MQSIQSQSQIVSLNFYTHLRSFSTTEMRTLKNALSTANEVWEKFCFQKSGLALPKRSVASIEIGLTLCGKQKIRSLNRDYRQKDKITDVLSFPVFEDLRAEDQQRDQEILLSQGNLSLGDIYICREQAVKQAKQHDIQLVQEVLHLYVHGLLHLVGFDHEISAAEDKLMMGHEQKLVKAIYKEIY